MYDEINRRKILKAGVAAGAVSLVSGWLDGQTIPAPSAQTDKIASTDARAQATPIRTTQLDKNLYMFRGVAEAVYLHTGPEGNLVIDTSPYAAVPNLLDAIAQVSAGRPWLLIDGHWHNAKGNESMHAAGYTVVAHQKTRERMSAPQTMNILHHSYPAAPAGALPSITFEQELHLWRNNEALSLTYIGPAHSDGDIAVRFHKADYLFVGDIWYGGMVPFFDEDSGGSIGGVIRACEKAYSLAGPDTKILTGEGPAGTRADLQKYRDALVTIRDRVAALKASGATEQEVIARRPAAPYDSGWTKSVIDTDQFVGLVYRTL